MKHESVNVNETVCPSLALHYHEDGRELNEGWRKTVDSRKRGKGTERGVFPEERKTTIMTAFPLLIS